MYECEACCSCWQGDLAALGKDPKPPGSPYDPSLPSNLPPEFQPEGHLRPPHVAAVVANHWHFLGHPLAPVAAPDDELDDAEAVGNLTAAAPAIGELFGTSWGLLEGAAGGSGKALAAGEGDVSRASTPTTVLGGVPSGPEPSRAVSQQPSGEQGGAQRGSLSAFGSPLHIELPKPRKPPGATKQARLEGLHPRQKQPTTPVPGQEAPTGAVGPTDASPVKASLRHAGSVQARGGGSPGGSLAGPGHGSGVGLSRSGSQQQAAWEQQRAQQDAAALLAAKEAELAAFKARLHAKVGTPPSLMELDGCGPRMLWSSDRSLC